MSPSPDRTSDDTPSPESELREALRFLGHDAREGHSSTLALLELQRIKPDPMAMAELVERVERNARRSLAAIDDFMDMAAARSQPLRHEEIDLADLLIELVADAWSLASRHGIRVQIVSSVDTAPMRADRELLARAIGKLLRDVADRAPRGLDVECSLAQDGGHWVIEIGDPESRADGAPPGPGYALVAVVARRHGGAARVDVRPGGGRIVRISLAQA